MKHYISIILGAETWPRHSGLTPSSAFTKSASFIRDYLTGGDGLGLRADDVLWLFNDDSQPAPIVERMKNFLRGGAIKDMTDVIFYYVGHGTYVGSEYRLALRCTDSENIDMTTLPVKAVAKALLEETPDKRHIVIIDACYAAGAVKDFIYMDEGAVENVREQAKGILKEISRGSALFCAAGARQKAKAPWDGEFTMFSGAIREALTKGDPTAPPYLSLQDLAAIVEREIDTVYEGDAVRPELHTPRQDAGDIKDIQHFPNAALRPGVSLETALKDLRDQVTTIAVAQQGIRTTLERMVASDEQHKDVDAPVPDVRGRVKYLVQNPSVPDAAVTNFLDVVLRAGVYVEQASWHIDIQEYKERHGAYRVRAGTEYHYVNMFSDQEVNFEVLYGVRPDDIKELEPNAEIGRYIKIIIGDQDVLRGLGPVKFSQDGIVRRSQVALGPLEKMVFRTDYEILMATGKEQGIRPQRFVKVLGASISNTCTTGVKIRVEKREMARPAVGPEVDPGCPMEELVVHYGRTYYAAPVQGIAPGERAFCFTLLPPA